MISQFQNCMGPDCAHLQCCQMQVTLAYLLKYIRREQKYNSIKKVRHNLESVSIVAKIKSGEYKDTDKAST